MTTTGIYGHRDCCLRGRTCRCLSNLADVIDNEETLAELLKTNDPDVVLKYLGEKQVSVRLRYFAWI